jgi:hypothetical protein
MPNEVYANNNEVACKAAAGKSICAFPDVCMTPPENPATPPGVPVPYPNTGFARDTTNGSKTVKISDKEIMKKNKSYFKTSYGDEAGCAAKKGVVTSTNRGKVYFIAWSMDVKIEGENADRHLDMTTHNHASPMANESLPMVYQDMLAALPPECDTMKTNFESACANTEVERVDSSKSKVKNCTPECEDAQKCILIPKDQDKQFCCGESTDDDERTGDHLIEVNCFVQQSGRGGMPFSVADLRSRGLTALADGLRGRMSKPIPLDPSMAGYDPEKAPTVCVGKNHSNLNHKKLQKYRDQAKKRYMRMNYDEPLDAWSDSEVSYWTYEDASAEGARAHKRVFPQCDEACTKAQLDAYHTSPSPHGAGISSSRPVKTTIVLG